jgi:lysine 2,3-aminomutase
MDTTTHNLEEDAEPPGGRSTSLLQDDVSQRRQKSFKIETTFPSLDSYLGITKTKFKIKSNFPISANSYEFLRRNFPGATEADWNDWHWQVAHRFTRKEELAKIFDLSADEKQAFSFYGNAMTVAVTPYYASLLDAHDSLHALRRAVIPVCHEYLHLPEEKEDPLAEDEDMPVPGLVHRYPDRVLFLVTNFCTVHCRYCTRSRMIRPNHKYPFDLLQWEKACVYIENHPEVRDVLISGGDPLSLSGSKIEWLLKRLRSIPHVELIRIGTKIPVVLPQRITPALVRMLKRYHPLWMSIHFTHPEELTPEVSEACSRLADAGIPLGSQTVLLAGINDNVETMKKLMQGLLKIRVRPYYLYQCDPIQGSSHFRTPVEKGLEIIAGLRGHTSGYAVPCYVIDAPGGGGKIPLLPNYVVENTDQELVLKNYQGLLFRYPQCNHKTIAL